MRLKAVILLSSLAVGAAACSGTQDFTGPGTELVADAGADSVRIGPRLDAAEAWDFGTPDAPGFELACEPGEGCFGSLCTDNSQCPGGWCVDHLGEGRCTTICQEDCPAGWTCQEVSWTFPDILFVCLSDFANLCKPCTTSQDCSGVGATQDVCVDYGDDGRFCGGSCGPDKPCPDGYECTADALTAEGGSSSQCVRIGGLCSCSAKSVALDLSTPCAIDNEAGRCEGLRTCKQEQIGDCSAPAPEAETCDGIDNDCDGDLDEATCDDGNPCTDDACVEGECQFAPNAAGCDDGNQCTIGDKCLDGSCAGGSVPNCNDGNPCTDDSCEPATGCVSTANQLPCQDGDVCTVDDTCDGGTCMPGAALACDDSNPCTDDSCNPATGCTNAANALPCDDGNACTAGDVCSDKACKAGPPLDCNDNNVCTTDLCLPASGCKNEANTAFCDDSSACTVGDKCDAGKCVPGAPLDCNDDNVCTDDSCVATQQGTPKCIHEPNTAPCGVGYVCSQGACNCVPNCAGKACGPDGCGGFCNPGGYPLCEKQTGVCSGAKKTNTLCANGQWLPCTKAEYFFNHNAYQEAPETVCDLLDNDCDGQADEDLGQTTCGLGACVHTVPNCVGGKLNSCDPLLGKTPEKCDAIDNDCNGVADDGLGSTTCGIGPCFHSQPNCEAGKPAVCDPLKGAALEKLDGIDNDCDGQTDEGFPVPGTIIITELMVNPDCVVDALGEWLELYNTTDQAWDVNGWALKDSGTDNVTLGTGAPLVIQSHGYLVVGRNGDVATNGHVTLSFVYPPNNFTLGNSIDGDEVILVGPGNVEVDKVAYSTALGFPDQNAGKGRTMSLKATAFSHVQNDTGSNWFQSNSPIPGGCGDKGTPAGPNL